MHGMVEPRLTKVPKAPEKNLWHRVQQATSVGNFAETRGCRNEKKKKLGVSNTLYDGGRWVTDGGWCVTDGGWWVTDGGWWVTDGGWWVTDGGWWVATKHQRVDAIVKKKKGERPYGNPWRRPPEFVW